MSARRLMIASAGAGLVLLGCTGGACAAACPAGEFGAAVDQAGAALRAFNLENAPKIQARLAELARKKGWPESERAEKLREFMADERIASLDETANALLSKIDTLGQVSPGGAPDCAKLDELKAAGVELLAVMKAKSNYTLAKIDSALKQSPAVSKEPLSPAPPAAGQTSGPKVAAPGEARPPAVSAPHASSKAPAAKPGVRQGENRTAAVPGVPGPAAPGGEAAWPGGTPPAGGSSASPPWAAVSRADPGVRREVPPPYDGEEPPLAGAPYTGGEGYTIEEIQDATRGFFGTVSAGLAGVIEHAFSEFGRPTAYVLGKEGGGAFLAGLRYGSGDLYLHRGSVYKVYWHGPSVGYDVGAEGSRTMFLIYNLDQADDLYRSFTGIGGSAYVVGGVGLTVLKGGKVIMAPIRSGLGLRLGANIGYIRFTPQPSWNPF